MICSRRKFPHNKGHLWKTYDLHHTQWRMTERVPLKVRNKTGCLHFLLLLNITLDVLVRAIRQNEINSIQPGKEELKWSLLQMTWSFTQKILKITYTNTSLLELINKFNFRLHNLQPKYQLHSYTLKINNPKRKLWKRFHLQYHQK